MVDSEWQRCPHALVRKCLWYEGPLMHGPQGSSPSYLDIKVGFLHRNTRFWGPVNSLLWRSVLCIVRCLAACMASTHYIPVAPPSWDKQKDLQTWPNVPWWEKCLMVENHWSKDNIPDKKDPHVSSTWNLMPITCFIKESTPPVWLETQVCFPLALVVWKLKSQFHVSYMNWEPVFRTNLIPNITVL